MIKERSPNEKGYFVDKRLQAPFLPHGAYQSYEKANEICKTSFGIFLENKRIFAKGLRDFNAPHLALSSSAIGV